MKTLTEKERWIVINGLMSAKDIYTKLAEQSDARLAQQFDLQAKQAKDMAERFEQANEIYLQD